jgi:hypothetical protein
VQRRGCHPDGAQSLTLDEKLMKGLCGPIRPVAGVHGVSLALARLLSSTQDGCDHAGIASSVEHGNHKEGFFFRHVGNDVIAYCLEP